MLQIWIPPLELEYPKNVEPKQYFLIEWNTWYLTTPFRKFSFFQRIENDKSRILWEEKKTIMAFWFWKKIKSKAIISVSDGIHNLEIKAGHVE